MTHDKPVTVYVSGKYALLLHRPGHIQSESLPKVTLSQEFPFYSVSASSFFSYFNMLPLVLSFCLLLVSTPHTASALIATISPASNTVQTTTSYTIKIRPAVSVPAGGYVQFTFPTEYKDLPTGAVQCDAADVVTATPTCSITGNVLKVTFATSLDTTTMNTFKTSLANPRWVVTLSTYQVQTFGASAQILESLNSGITNTFIASEC